jgi:DNA repair protein RadA/Sms
VVALAYKCRGCNAPPRSEPWRGRCPSCGGYWDCVRAGSDANAQRATAASLTSSAPVPRIPTGIANLDSTVLGGGLFPGCVYLLAGGKGCGKSTLAMMLADAVASPTRPVIYASGEEATARVGEIARRQRVTNDHIEVMGDACDIDVVLERCREVKPTLLVVDSLQVMTTDDCEGSEGTTAQAEATINGLQSHCLRTGTCALVLNHMQKGGNDLAGPEVVGHLVDVVLFLDRVEDEDAPGLRVLHAPEKNRTASTEAEAYFVMESDGHLAPRRQKSRLVSV